MKLNEKMNPEQRREFLEVNCTEQKTKEYNRELSQEEIEKERFNYVEGAVELEARKDEIKEEKKELDNEIKQLETIQEERLERIKSRSIKVFGTLYGMRNFETNQMEYYNIYGDVIDRRPLVADEMQGDLFKTEQGGPEPVEPKGLPAPDEKPKSKRSKKQPEQSQDEPGGPSHEENTIQDAEFEIVEDTDKADADQATGDDPGVAEVPPFDEGKDTDSDHDAEQMEKPKGKRGAKKPAKGEE